jgi:hypothetical protein
LKVHTSNTLSNTKCFILSYLFFDSHWTCLRSCAGLDASFWSLACPIIPFFHLFSNVFSTTLRIGLDFSHPFVLEVSHCICNQPLDPTKIHFFIVHMVGKGRPYMMLCKIKTSRKIQCKNEKKKKQRMKIFWPFAGLGVLKASMKIVWW